MTDDEVDAVIDVDLKGTFRLTRAVLPVMVQGGRGGVIINISSTPAVAGHTEGAPYTLAKAGIAAMTKHIALEYGPDNIRHTRLRLATSPRTPRTAPWAKRSARRPRKRTP